MEPFFPFVLLGLAVGLLIWGVSNLSVAGEVHEALRHHCHGCRRGGAGLVFHDVWERWPSVCSFLGTSSRRTVGLGADRSRCGAATRQNLCRDSDGPGNGPPALGDQRGSEWRTSSPALRTATSSRKSAKRSVGEQGSSRAASSPLCSHSLGKPGRPVRKMLKGPSPLRNHRITPYSPPGMIILCHRWAARIIGDGRSLEWNDVRVRIDSRNFSKCK